MPPKKRPRQDDDDSLDAILNKKLRSIEKLKNAFESIFEKYGQDLSEVADEIDMRTGRIIIDNGHLGAMDDVEEQSAWKSGTRRPADGHLETSPIRAQSTAYHFTAAEKRLCFILRTKGYRTREMIPYFPDRPLPSLQQWQCTISRLNPIFVGALQEFAKNAVSNEFKGSRTSYLQSPGEESPILEDANPSMNSLAWSEEENARLIRLYHAKMRFLDMVLYFRRKSADDLKSQLYWIQTKHPNLIGSAKEEWSATAEDNAKPNQNLIKRIARDITEKSDLYYDRPWTDIEDKILISLQANDDLLFHAHDIFHRSRRSIGRRLQDIEAGPEREEQESLNSDMKTLQGRRRPRKSEPIPDANAGKLRPNRPRRSEPISLLTDKEHDMSESRDSGLTPVTVSRKRGPGRPPKLSTLPVSNSPNHSAANAAKYHASPSVGRKRDPGRPLKPEQILPSVDLGSSYESSTEAQSRQSRNQERLRGHSSEHVSTPGPEAILEILTKMSQTSETSSISDAIREAQFTSMEQNEESEQDSESGEAFGLPILSPGDSRTPKPMLRDINPSFEGISIQDTDHTTSLSAMPSSLEQTAPSEAKSRNMFAESPPERKADETHPGNEGNPDGGILGDLNAPPRKDTTEKKRRRKKRKSVVFHVRSRKRREARKSLATAKPLRTDESERHCERSSPLQNNQNASQVPQPADHEQSKTERTPRYLRTQTFKTNGRPKQRLFSLSLDSSQTRRLLSGE